MASRPRVFNLTRKFWMKSTRALRAVEECACVWVEFGVSVRDLSLAESIAARNGQAQLRSPIPLAEIPGLVYRPAAGREAAHRAEVLTTTEANQFARLATA